MNRSISIPYRPLISLVAIIGIILIGVQLTVSTLADPIQSFPAHMETSPSSTPLPPPGPPGFVQQPAQAIRTPHTPIPIPTPDVVPDAYGPEDACAQARAFAMNGPAQAHNFHRSYAQIAHEPQCGPDGISYMPAGAPLPERPGSQSTATGGPDDFGYTWDDSVLFNWIDAKALGVNSNLYGGDVYTGPINIGFTFRFYENNYTQLYFSTKGLVSFGQGGSWFSNIAIPSPAIPNNLIVPFWDDLGMYRGNRPDAGIYTYQGGTAPNRYLVVEWYRADAYSGSGNSGSGSYDLTFEVILYENGDIVMQYLNLSGNLQSATVGIEDDWGVTGLQYLYNAPGLSNYKAVRFYRPAPMTRVKVYPLYQSHFTRAGATETFQMPIRNTGDLGADTYDLATSSSWPASLYRADGTTPLTDTDGDGAVDTGSVAQGSTVTITVKVQTPAMANVGSNNTATIIVRSSRNTAVQKTVTLQTAVPAPFAQVYRDDADGAMSLYLVQPAGQFVKKTTANNYYGYSLAVAEMPSGNFIYAWRKGRSVGSIYVNEIEYTLLNRYGDTVRAVSKLTDHSGATVYTYDYPAVAVAPNGRIGVLWYRYLYNSSNSQFNYNIYFAILDTSGNLVYGPLNLTKNTVWGVSSDLNVPRFYSPHIAATGDNRFVLAWQRSHQESAGWVDDIYYAVRDSGGNEVKTITKLTDDTAGSSWYGQPALTSLASNRVFISWFRGQEGNDDIYYAVISSAGSLVKTATDLSVDETVVEWGNYDAVQLSDGKILAVWEAWGCFSGEWTSRIRFALLDASYNRIGTPTCLSKAAAATSGDIDASVTADAAGHAIITWMDRDSSYRRNLYYALVDGNSNVLTQPMIFRTSQATVPYIETSFEGYGNTSYSWTPPAGADGYVTVTTPVSGTVGGYGAVPVYYGNMGAQMASSVVLEAVLGAGLAYAADTSGLNPIVAGNSVRWSLPNLFFMDRREFILYVQVPGTATIGAHLPVTMTLTSAGPELNPADNSAVAEVIANPRPGGPDDFGYTWDDSVPLNWIDATSGTDTGMSGSSSGQKVGPITLPFSFKYYENTYSSLYIAASGYLAFTDEGTWPGQSRIPLPAKPNNVVAPYWTPIYVSSTGPTGRVYYKSGGTAPNRYFVVEWHDVNGGSSSDTIGGDDTYRFEVILYENGDIVFQYHTMNYNGNWWCGAAGIEDSSGLDGLAYGSFCQQYASNKAVRFYRPAPAARVKVYPLDYGRFTRAGETVAFQVPIRNTGELGADTYDLSTSSSWPASLYRADGTTPLTDTDGDGAVDTGSVAQGSTVTITVKVQTPAMANVGSNNTAAIIVRSSRNTAVQKTVTLQTAVPAPFAQVYRDNADGAMSIYLVQPAGQSLSKATSDNYYGYDMTVAEMPNGNFVYAWYKGRSVGSVDVREIEYILLNNVGNTVRAVSKLTNHSGAMVYTYDEYPAVAVAPNGRIGLLWYRYLYNSSNSTWNYNIYHAVLDASGNIVVPPTNLTDNPTWGYG